MSSVGVCVDGRSGGMGKCYSFDFMLQNGVPIQVFSFDCEEIHILKVFFSICNNANFTMNETTALHSLFFLL